MLLRIIASILGAALVGSWGAAADLDPASLPLHQEATWTAPDGFPDWAFPGLPAAARAGSASESPPLRVPGSSVTYKVSDLHHMSAAPDWFPDEHPPAPPGILAARSADVWACGFCHLPNGNGRPENAVLAGLPAAYIRAEIAAFRSGERRSANPDWPPTRHMIEVAQNATDDEIEAAANYFSSGKFTSRVTVTEAPEVPKIESLGFIWHQIPGQKEPIGKRIVEMPVDAEDFEKRDPHAVFVADVPPGSLSSGRRLAEGQGERPPCASCHGEGLRGGGDAVGPPLAGRSPTYLFRQLYGFKLGVRSNAGAEPMRVLARTLSEDEMIALAAYAASLPTEEVTPLTRSR